MVLIWTFKPEFDKVQEFKEQLGFEDKPNIWLWLADFKVGKAQKIL